MGRRWQIGDPVDYTSDGWMDAQNWTGDHVVEEEKSESGNSGSDEYSKMAWDYYNDFKSEEALHYIDLSLDLYDRSSSSWNLKGLILEDLNRYDEALGCYDKSLQLHPENAVYDNKARTLLKLANDLLDESKKLPNGLDMLGKALDKILKAINTLPGENSKENLDRYLYKRDEINYYISYEKEYQKNLEILKSSDKNELFTLTGTKFYENSKKLKPGMPLKLVKEPDNEHDNDAIAVYLSDEKVGYVANNDYTKHELTSSASELQDKIPNVIRGEYLFCLSRYSAIEFDIVKIIK